MKYKLLDLFCGLGGWTEAFMDEGYECVGVDIERHDYGTGGYPAQLILQDVRTLHGSRFKNFTAIAASPPCQEFSYMAMPWSRAKQIERALRGVDDFPRGYTGSRTIKELTALFDECFRIQREASEAAGHHIPMVVENVRGACKWVGRAKWHYGSFYLWGDVPALMPINFSSKALQGCTGSPWYGNKEEQERNRGLKGIPHKPAGHWTNPDENGTKQGGDWWNKNARNNGAAAKFGSKSNARKMASAMIAKIPYPLALHIARCFKVFS